MIALMQVKMGVEQIGTVVVSSVAVEREMFAVESFESHVTGEPFAGMIAFQFVPVLVVCNCSSSRGSKRRQKW